MYPRSLSSKLSLYAESRSHGSFSVLIDYQSKWDPDNLHRHPDFVPIKKESMMDISHNQPEPSLPKRDYALDMGTSIADVEDEFGSE